MATNTYIENYSTSDLVDYWNKSINLFESNLPVTTNGYSDCFSMLNDVGFITKSLDKYNNNVRELVSFLRGYQNIVKNYINSMNSFDSNIELKIPGTEAEERSINKEVNINVEDNITSSDMSDLKRQTERLKNKYGISIASLYFKNVIQNKENLKNINKMMQNVLSQYNDTYSITNISLDKLKNSQQSYVLYNDSNILIKRSYLNKLNKYQNVSSKAFTNNYFNYDKLKGLKK